MSLTVIQILPALISGGVEQGVLQTARHLAGSGHHSMVISSGGKLADELTQTGTEHINLPIGKKSLFLLKYVPVLKKLFLRADVVNVHSRFPAWLAYFAWRGLPDRNRPGFITTFHGAYSINSYSAIMTRGQKVIAVSEYIRDYIINNFPDTGRDKIIVIPRGIDPAKYNKDFKAGESWLRNWYQQHPDLENKFILTSPGRITRLKGHETFLKIIGQLIKKGLNVHGLVAGDYHPGKKKYYDFLKGLSGSLGVEQHVTFTGQRNDLREIMSISDIVFSLTSKPPEAFGLTTLEALSLGTPVIGYNHGGTGEILNRLFNTGLVEPGNIDKAVELAEKFYREKPAVTDHNPYLLEKTLDLTISCYEELAGNKN